MAIFSNRNQRIQQRGFAASSHDDKHGNRESNGRDRRPSHKFSDWFRFKQRQLYNHGTRESVPIHVNISRAGNYKPDCNPKSYRRYFNNRYNKCLYAVAALFLTTPAYANVGGVSATANPIANSSGSVTNQVHSGAPGNPYITNTYGNGIQCQGSSHNELHSLYHSFYQ